MPKFITSRSASGEEVQISYKDYGQGRPIVLIHGWPLSKDMWEYQIDDLVGAGLRVVKYDRRGFGKSDKPWDGYDYDTFANDLKAVLDELDLRDAVLVGFSMGGGEIARYIARYGTDRVSGAVFVASVLPYLSKNGNNPDGVDPAVFADIVSQIKDDRIAFLDDFGKKFFGINIVNHPVSNPLLEYYRDLAAAALPRATVQAAMSWAETDFREDVKKVTVPTLIIHGSSDKTVPIEASSDRLAQLLPEAEYKVYDGAPHGLFYTHRKELNGDLIEFATTRVSAVSQQSASA